jgi:schlafen family protein
MDFDPFEKDISSLVEADLSKLISKGVAEGWYVEYKSDFPSSKKIGHSIAAFANSDGGWYILGVDADKTTNVAVSICGFDLATHPNPKDTVRNIVAKIGPTPYFTSQLILLPNNRACLVIYVEKGFEAPYVTLDGKIYRRVGEGSDPIAETDHYAIQKLFERRLERKDRIESFSYPPFSLPYGQTGYQQGFLEAYFYTQPVGNIVIKDFFSMECFKEICEIFSSQTSILPSEHITASMPFSNVFTSSGSYLIRSIPGPTQSFNFTPTLELFPNGNLKVVMPIPELYIKNPESLPEIYQNSPHIRVFIQKVPRDVSLFVRIIDGNALYVIFLIIFSLYCKLLKKYKVCEKVTTRFRLSNIARTLLYLDNKDYLDFLTKHGLPLNEKDKIDIPVFSNGFTLPPVDVDQTEALFLAWYLWNALGFPLAYAAEAKSSVEGIINYIFKISGINASRN